MKRSRLSQIFLFFWAGWIFFSTLLFILRLIGGVLPDFFLFEVIDSRIPPLQPPSAHHWFGTDELGRDLLLRLLFGTCYSLLFAIPVAVATAFIAALFGVSRSFLKPTVKLLLSSFSDVVGTLPLLPLILVSLAIYPGQMAVVAFMKIFLGWTTLSQLVFLESELLFSGPMVLSAKAQGISTIRIASKFVAPQLFHIVRGYFPLLVFSNILTLSALDYFGLGFPIPIPTLAQAFQPFQDSPHAWWLFVFPFLVLTSLLQGFRLLTTRKN